VSWERLAGVKLKRDTRHRHTKTTPDTRPVNVLLLSTYELGHQPLTLARPAAHLLAAGHDVACTDLSVENLDEQKVRSADFIGISVPMHTATRLGARLAERVRRLNPGAHVCFYGLYASLNADGLLGRYADSVIGGEYETPLVELVGRLGQSQKRSRFAAANGGSSTSDGPSDLPIGVSSLDLHTEVFLGRQQFELPHRDLLPPLERYVKLDDGSRLKLTGYVEASRGCAHRCLHCPITPVYGGRLRIVQEQVVLEDVRRLVRMGAEHITFGDPDFFNGVKHSCRIVQALHDEFPDLTYDATIKVEHLLEHRSLLPLLKETGCLFIISAVEAVDDQILAHLAKGHTAADVETALELTLAAGLILRPTFVAFSPWTTLGGYLNLLEFIERHRLVLHVDPVQYAIRLLVPRGSSLLGTAALDGYVGAFNEATFTYTWKHVDHRVDALQARIAAAVENAAGTGHELLATFQQIKGLALSALGQPIRASPTVQPMPSRAVPRLTEPWFC
jgi:radical SAM superfamily enzyme YgiQ (UPF0313 family)